jgi:hypothetical protein
MLAQEKRRDILWLWLWLSWILNIGDKIINIIHNQEKRHIQALNRSSVRLKTS